MVIETERLLLRPVSESDDHDIFEYSRQEDVGPNAGWKPHESIDETREIIAEFFMKTKNSFGIVLKDSGKLIGTVGLVDDQKRENDEAMMLGYSMSAEYWGRGYMTEAAEAVVRYGFRELNLKLVSAYCYPGNERSKNVLKKLGFCYEGTLSLCEKLYDGKIYDNECYALKAAVTK